MAENSIDFSKYITGEEALKSAARSTRGLGKSVAELAKTFDADATRIKASAERINEALRSIQANGGKLNLTSSEADKKLLQDYIGQVSALGKAKAILRESEAAQAATMKVVTEATQQQTTALKQQQEALRAAARAGDVEGQKKAAAAIRQTKVESEQLSRAVRGVNSQFTATKGSYDALTLANGKLLAQLRGLESGLDSTSKEARELRFQISANTATLTDFDRQLGQNFRNVGNYPKGLKAAGVGALDLVQNLSGVTIGLAGVAQGLGAVFASNSSFSKDAVGVRKTTGQTAEEFDSLADSLKALDTPTTLKGLTEIARVGGSLGESKEDILDFTKSVDVAVQALGDDFSGGAEQIATELGKISNVFRKELGPDTAANILAIGSAVNELGAEGAATAPFLTDVALRTGAVSAQFNVGLKNALAYAAVLEETGFSAETSGTALNRLFSTLATKTEASFRIAQKANPALTLKEFTRLVNTDFNAAIQLFLKGLNAGGKTTTQLNDLLATLKLQSGEAKNVIITLAQNTDLFATRQKTANDQLRDATSLGKEAALVNDTLSGSVDKLTNDVSNFFTSGTAGRFLKFFVDFTRDLYAKTIGDTFRAIGNGVDLLQEKFGGAEKPQKEYTLAVVSTTQAMTKQGEAGQKLLDSYTALRANTKRTAAQELQLAELRSQLVAKFGTAEADAVQLSLKRNKDRIEANKQGLKDQLAYYDGTVVPGAQKTAAQLQDAATKAQAAFSRFGLSPEGVKNLKEAAASNGLMNSLAGRSYPKEQLEGAKQLNAAEAALAAGTARLTKEQQQRAAIAAALAKLQPALTKATVEGTEALEDAGEVEETLDRAAKARSDARRERLKGELEDNQRRIDGIKKFQTEQARLFENQQISPEIFAAAVAGTQDAITQLERDGTALRLRIAREETAGKLVEIENERIRSSDKKKISAAELTDINAAAAAKTLAATRELERKVAAIRREGQTRLEEMPIEFKVAKLDMSQAEKDQKRAIDNSEKQVVEAGRRQQQALDDEVQRVADAEQRKKDLRQRALDVGIAAGFAVFDIQRNRLEALSQAEQLSYQTSLENAGENAKLREALEEEHQRKQSKIRRKQAENERKQALFSILVNTAMAVGKDLATYGFLAAIPFIAADIILGGIQTATVLSSPIPQFFKGTDYAPQGWAEVAERGPELIQERKTGKVRLAEKHTIEYLNTGDKVFTADQTRRIMAGAAADVASMQQPMQLSSTLTTSTAAIQAGRTDHGSAAHARQLSGIEAAMRDNANALKNLKQVTVHVSGEGASASIQQGSSLVRSLNQRLQSYGG